MSIITLTTDFSTGSPYVAALKGVIYTINPQARIVDLTHDIPAQDVRRGAVVLDDVCERFPADTIHVVVVDPGVGTDRAIVYARIGTQQYIAPDNVEYRYNGETPDEWLEWLDAIYEEVGPDAYLTDERLTSEFITGDYALGNPWEWYSENMIAYVYLAMVDSARSACSPNQWLALTDWFLADTIAAEWPLFRFENARGAPFMAYLADAYPLRAEDVAFLAERYLLDAQPGLCDCR